MRPTDPSWQRWQEVDRVFIDALDRPAPERESFVRVTCGEDAELRDAVLALLAAERASEDHFQPPSGEDIQAALDELGVAPGTRIGPWRVLRSIGRGGMGSVYLAERADADFQQRVALKLLRRGLDTDDVVRRFLNERRILAGLTHPNIARLLDGGASDDSRPYLVMEYVEGTTITDYCDAHGLDVHARLELFLRVTDAVRHAHTKLVVHRDIKPSNILVTGEGRVKLLDFGIARLLADDGAEVLTRTGVRLHTPEYASPEQLGGEPITTASDIYQLGVLLCVLLTGRRPFTDGRARDASALPPRPDTLVGDDEAGTAAARARSTTPDRLRRQLRGDLENIVARALRPEPDRRYESAERLADDVRRHLDGLPVTARPYTLRYRTAKLLRRQRWIAPAAAATLAVAVLYGVTSARHTARLEQERDRAEREAATARAVTAFLTDLFRSGDPFASASDTVSVVGLLERGADRVRGGLEDQPLVRAELLRALGTAYTGLGRYEVADSMHREALDIARAEGPPDAPPALRALLDLAGHKRAARDFVAADTLLREALALLQGRSDTLDAAFASVYAGLADVLIRLDAPDSAIVLANRAIAIRRAAGDTLGTAYHDALGHLGPALRAAGALDSAETIYRDLLRRQTALHGPDDIQLAGTHNNLGFLLRTRGDYAGAEASYREGLRITGTVLGDAHPAYTMFRGNLAGALEPQGKLDEVEAIVRAQIAAVTAEWPDGHWRLGSQHEVLGRFFTRHGRFAEAIEPFARAERSFAATLGPDHDWTLIARTWRGLALRFTGRAAEGLALMDGAFAGIVARRPLLDGNSRFDIDQIVQTLETHGDTARATAYGKLLERQGS